MVLPKIENDCPMLTSAYIGDIVSDDLFSDEWKGVRDRLCWGFFMILVLRSFHAMSANDLDIINQQELKEKGKEGLLNCLLRL